MLNRRCGTTTWRLEKRQANRNQAAIDAILAPYSSLFFDDAAAENYAAIRHHLEATGQPIGPLDIQIAAIAVTHNCTLVTHNTAEFSRVPGLMIEDWQIP